MAAIVAIAAQSRGIGYKGDLVRSYAWFPDSLTFRFSAMFLFHPLTQPHSCECN